jgi:uncharacterized protein with PIN domain
MVVVDTSAVLAVFFGEPSARWVSSQLTANARALRMSTVNLTETLIHIRDRQPQLAEIGCWRAGSVSSRQTSSRPGLQHGLQRAPASRIR